MQQRPQPGGVASMERAREFGANVVAQVVSV
jgi:hypothetical protein